MNGDHDWIRVNGNDLVKIKHGQDLGLTRNIFQLEGHCKKRDSDCIFKSILRTTAVIFALTCIFLIVSQNSEECLYTQYPSSQPEK